MYDTPLTALVLSGGGARAAYQVGVLRAIARLRRSSGAIQRRNPFGVICGTSAGAINAAALACNADQYDAAVDGLATVWEQFHAEQVYRADSLGVIRSGAQWLTMLSVGWLIARWRKARPRSLLDNTPLAELLEQLVPLHRLPRLLHGRHVQALAVTASNYNCGEHVTFYQSAAPVAPWPRLQRVAMPVVLTPAHLLASSAIPFVFPATELPMGERADAPLEWFGDGSMRQTAPISPAIHLGAQRVLVIGAGRMHERAGPPQGRIAQGAAQSFPIERAGPPQGRMPQGACRSDPNESLERPVGNSGYPNLAQIAGHTLAGIFQDALAVDVERLERINRTLALLSDEARLGTPLRPIDALVIAPSQRLDDIAAVHQGELPRPVRALLRGLGVSGQGRSAQGAALASYLLFEAGYTRELIALGEADVQARRDEVLAFFGWPAARTDHRLQP